MMIEINIYFIITYIKCGLIVIYNVLIIFWGITVETNNNAQIAEVNDRNKYILFNISVLYKIEFYPIGK